MNDMQCTWCRYFKMFKYYDTVNGVWWDGFICAIPDEITDLSPNARSENMFRAIGNKNPHNDCSDFAEIQPEVLVGM